MRHVLCGLVLVLCCVFGSVLAVDGGANLQDTGVLGARSALPAEAHLNTEALATETTEECADEQKKTGSCPQQPAEALPLKDGQRLQQETDVRTQPQTTPSLGNGQSSLSGRGGDLQEGEREQTEQMTEGTGRGGQAGRNEESKENENQEPGSEDLSHSTRQGNSGGHGSTQRINVETGMPSGPSTASNTKQPHEGHFTQSTSTDSSTPTTSHSTSATPTKGESETTTAGNETSSGENESASNPSAGGNADATPNNSPNTNPDTSNAPNNEESTSTTTTTTTTTTTVPPELTNNKKGDADSSSSISSSVWVRVPLLIVVTLACILVC
ncbi:uncharacterized protein TM35_000501350 [Trypanosoma theileri]|uniref:Mucin TcMUCII n=1 Tax=Trypanosoma theileri TaxID=67003 RepID=A0A1X0NHL0_9TRYP|nr:uncharacterized protein TM35_000501350 [Trypanosoma theileri]ORC84081.1 hypothetical protein TM35_000501350 [Trypanosoma theileri]